ncbi:uncharacterized protein G2W53_041968 [Senna tora]|uniref:Uncharacterized protein n=1 Tax=Senna tora TaxID=362788 RepID=A0A834SG58_9FABA|nr:uncharacterized protein G2W53_041968 [Senna tora]
MSTAERRKGEKKESSINLER